MQFSEEEIGLVAVIFGARLMQEKDLHEKQIILLTGSNEQLEVHIEQQLRELTLLPLNVKHMPMQDFQKRCPARRNADYYALHHAVTAIFTPLIHADLALTPHQQQQIRKILES